MLITLIMAIALMFICFQIGLTIGKFKGAKDGIDYCLKRQADDAQKQNLTNLKG